jgi:hypothetical protein
MNKLIALAFIAGFAFIASGSGVYAQFMIPVVSACAGQSYTAGQNRLLTQDTTGDLCTSGAGGGGGGAVTIANGADVALGSTTDIAAIGPPSTLMAVMRQIDADINGAIAPQASGAAAPIGAVNLCDGANTANPCTTAATILAASTASAPTNKALVVSPINQDPCSYAAKTNFAIASAAAEPQLVAPSGTTQVYVCSLSLIIGTPAVTVSLVGGTGAACTTGTPVAALGSTTAANGMSLAVNGGLTLGNGLGTVVRTTTAGHGLCILQSGTTPIAGNITYVQQ